MEEKENLKKDEIPNKSKEEKEKEKEASPQLKEEEKKLEGFNSEEFELKDHYSIDDISYSNFEATIKNIKRKIYNISQAIFIDNLEELKKLLEKNEALINKKTMEGFSLIQYAALNGAIIFFELFFLIKKDFIYQKKIQY